MTQKNVHGPPFSPNPPESAESFKLPPAPFLYPILDSNFSEDLPGDAKQLIRAGIKVVQFRCKNLTKQEAFFKTEMLLDLCNQSGVLLVINDLVDIALVANVAGVHLGQDDFPITEARKLLPENILGFSTHTREQYVDAQIMPADYVAIGPLFPTSTKDAEYSPIGLAFSEWINKIKKKPVVCIGGITSANASQVIQAGADGVAIISALYRERTIYDAARKFLEALE